MEEQFVQIPQGVPTTPPVTRKTKWWIFVLGFLTIIALGIIVDAVWTEYFSPAAQEARRMKEQYAAYEQQQKTYEEALAQDTYGGKTPEETLALFIAAIEKEDIDLASKYFIQDINLSRQKWVDFLTKIKDGGNLQRFATDLKNYQEKNETISDSNFAFIYKNDDGTVGLQIDMKLNEQTKIWKIENI